MYRIVINYVIVFNGVLLFRFKTRVEHSSYNTSCYNWQSISECSVTEMNKTNIICADISYADDHKPIVFYITITLTL